MKQTASNTETAKLKTLKKYTVLCVEDDEDVLKELVSFFGRYFAKVYSAANAADAWEQFCRYNQSVVFCDIVMKGGSGIELAKQIKQMHSETVIAFLSGKTDPETIIKTIALKPIDFVPKPIKFSKLITLLTKISDELGFDAVPLGEQTEIDFKAMQIKTDNGIFDITAKEAKLLKLLCGNQGHTVSYDTIQKVVWGNEEMSDSSLKSLLYRIRSKIGKEKIKTLSGVGVRLEC